MLYEEKQFWMAKAHAGFCIGRLTTFAEIEMQKRIVPVPIEVFFTYDVEEQLVDMAPAKILNIACDSITERFLKNFILEASDSIEAEILENILER